MKKLTNIEFIKRAKDIHSNIYNYSLVEYKNSHTKVIIICPEHGEFTQKPYKHLSGQKCIKCSGKIVSSLDSFIKKSVEIHGNKYDYSLVDYKSSYCKIQIICKKHGPFEQTPNSHLAKHGCPSCSNKAKITKESFIKRAVEIHGEKYDYSKIEYVLNNTEKLKITCFEHGVFFQSSDGHLNQKQGCPSCKESKGERIIANFLINNNLKFIKQKTFKSCLNSKTGRKLKFDFYLPEYNICIEYDGKQHFTPIKRFGGENGYNSTIYRDNIKNEFCVLNKIELIRIKYNERILNKLKKIKHGNFKNISDKK